MKSPSALITPVSQLLRMNGVSVAGFDQFCNFRTLIFFWLFFDKNSKMQNAFGVMQINSCF
ncbi:hypothetical protein DO70_423 [Burkholderia pseudomallei]|nr:hypothetical protein DO70_423 [Burkholderia pseudomallei]